MKGRLAGDRLRQCRGEQRPAVWLGENPSLHGGVFIDVAGIAQEIGQLASAGVAAAKPGDQQLAQAFRQDRPPREPGSDPVQVAKGGIAAEQLVTAQTRKRHGRTSRPGQAAGVISVEPIAGRLVASGDEITDVVGHFRPGQDQAVMVGSEMAGGGGRRIRFGIFLYGETDRKGPQPGAARPGHQRRHRRRVQTAGEKNPHRHVRHGVGPDGVFHPASQLVNEIRTGPQRRIQVGIDSKFQ